MTAFLRFIKENTSAGVKSFPCLVGYQSIEGRKRLKLLKSTFLKTTLLVLAFLYASAAQACTTCNKVVQEGIFNARFGWYLLAMLAPFVLMGVIVSLLYRMK